MSSPSAADLMDRHVVTLLPETHIHEAMGVLLRKHLSGAPVVDPQGRLLGYLSEKDCFKVITAEAFDGVPEGCVADYMTSELATLSPTASLYDIVARFLETPYRRLPVVDREGLLLGAVNRRHALAAIDSMHDNSYLYGSEDLSPPDEESGGVDSAMRRARRR